MLVPPPRSNLLSFSSPLFPPVSLIFSALLSGDDRRKARVSVVLMMKRRRKVAHYTFDVDSRGKSRRDVTGRARRARKKCARPAEGKKARVRDFRCARFARFRAKERHAAFVSIIILSTPRSLSLSLYPVVSLSSFLSLSLVGESFALAIESERIAVLLRTFFSPFLFCFLLSFFFYEHRIPRTQRQ